MLCYVFVIKLSRRVDTKLDLIRFHYHMLPLPPINITYWSFKLLFFLFWCNSGAWQWMGIIKPRPTFSFSLRFWLKLIPILYWQQIKRIYLGSKLPRHIRGIMIFLVIFFFSSLILQVYEWSWSLDGVSRLVYFRTKVSIYVTIFIPVR